MVDQAVATYGRLDGLVCNAGFVRDRTVFNMSEDEWDQVIDVHLKGHFAPTRWATAHWRERFKETGEPANAAIVYTASEAGLFGNAGQPNYSAAKAGIASLGIVVAREMQRYGVTCNTVNPRARTRMTINTFGADKLTARGGRVRRQRPGQRVAVDRLPVQRPRQRTSPARPSSSAATPSRCWRAGTG